MTAPPPSLKTKPSRSASHGRLASAGESLRVERAFAWPKPPRPLGVVAISPPPAIIMSASPYWIVRIPSPMAWVDVVHAVTTPRFGPFRPYLIDRCPPIMLTIEAGMKNGEIFRGPPFRKLSYSCSMVPRPPMPAPQTAPQRSASSLLKSIPDSVTAWIPAATPQCMNSSTRRACVGVMYCVTSKSGTEPPKRTGKADTSNLVIGPIPLSPRTTASQADLTVLPTGEMMPRPVTTTRRLLTRYLYEEPEGKEGARAPVRTMSFRPRSKPGRTPHYAQ